MELQSIINESKKVIANGHVADYIPALATVDPKQLGISLYDVTTGICQQAGDSQTSFAIESVSKVFSLLLAIELWGLPKVSQYVDTRQSGFPFNSILNMEIEQTKRPLNPFINAGAIVITSLIVAKKKQDAFAAILDYVQRLCHNSTSSLATTIYQSEAQTGDMNRSLAYYLKSKGMLAAGAKASLTTYFKQCSLLVTANDLANFGAVLANDGITPWSCKRLIDSSVATYVKSVMMTTGLYNESGIYSAQIGIPTKSGVGGGLVAAAPHKYGIGIFSPALDQAGNSIAGLAALKMISQELDLDIFK